MIGKHLCEIQEQAKLIDGLDQVTGWWGVLTVEEHESPRHKRHLDWGGAYICKKSSTVHLRFV